MPILSATNLFIFCTFVVLSTCEEKSSITAISPEQVKNIGENTILNCTVNNPQDNSVIWIKKARDNPTNNVILSLGNQLTMKDPKFELQINNETLTYQLHIKDIQVSDAAIYECQIIVSTNDKITSHVELLVRTPPKINEATTTSVTVATGRPAELKCFADGYPRPNIQWIREHNAIMPTGGHSFNGNILKLSSVSIQDHGTYYCVAENVVGTDRKHVDFEVEFAPIISIPRPKVAQALDYDIELECNVMAYPAPAILWFKDNVQIINNDDYGTSLDATVSKVTNSVLRVYTIESSQYGDYYCKASNKIGHSEARINLYDQLIPNINFSGLQQWSSSESLYHCNSNILFGCVAIALNFYFL